MEQVNGLATHRVSHPTRVRGLKRVANDVVGNILQIAPYAGAWIETPVAREPHTHQCESHPTRVRGLKRANQLFSEDLW